MTDYNEGAGAVTSYRFAPIPEDVLYDQTLSSQAVRVYGVLMRHGLTPDACYPSHERIGKSIGVSARSVQRPLAELVKAGWVRKFRRTNARGERTSDGYHVETDRAELRAPTAQKRPLVQRAETSEERKPVVNESKKNLAPDGAKERAESILKEVWHAKQARGEPTPASFIGARKVIEKLLAAGWSDTKLKAAAMHAPTISLAAMEFQLNGRSNGAQEKRDATLANAAAFIEKAQARKDSDTRGIKA